MRRRIKIMSSYGYVVITVSVHVVYAAYLQRLHVHGVVSGIALGSRLAYAPDHGVGMPRLVAVVMRHTCKQWTC